MLGYSVSTGPAHGAVTLNAETGAYTYNPGANFNGSDSFQVKVADGNGGFTTQTVSVGVASVNDAPVADASALVATNEDTAVSGKVVASDVDGDVLGYSVSTGPAHGAVTLNAETGAYTYNPGANFNGSDSFQVKVADGNGGFTTQTVSVGVASVNDAPVADASALVATNEDTAVSGKVVASDVDGDVLGYSVSTGPAHGAVTLNAETGAYTYNPGANFNGSDSFQVKVADGNGGFTTQTVSVGVASVNDAPVSEDGVAVTTDEDTPVTGEVVATDVDGDKLSFKVSQDPANGKVTLDEVTGKYTYTPGDNFHGTDSFEVTVDDGNGGTATQILKVEVKPINDAPVTDAAVSITMQEDTGIYGQVTATDADGDTLSFSVETGPQHGALSLDATTGAYKYASVKDYNGSDSFDIKVADGNGGFATQHVTVGIASVNDAPVVTNANVTLITNEDTKVSGQVVASDVDGDVLGYSVSTGPAHGAVTLNAETGAYTYNPGANFNGSDSFQVKVADGNGGFTTQTVSVGVASVNDAPVVANATTSLSTSEDKAVSGQVVASDVDGDTLAWSLSTGPAHGTVTLNAATGQYTYTPAANYSGTDVFHVTVTDPSGAISIQKVDVAISAVADVPTLTAVSPVVVPINQILAGLAANDVLNGGAGNDTISGGAGNDTISGTGAATLTVALDITATLKDLDGSEHLNITLSNVPDGGVLSAGHHNSDGTWSLTSADLHGLQLSAIVTSNFTVTVTATATETTGETATATAQILVQLGEDNNILTGGAGNDTIQGGTGNDIIFGGDKPTGTSTGHVSTASDDDIIHAGDGNDLVYGNSGNDQIWGDSGNDTIYGGKGDDIIFGGTGNDVLHGNSGNDIIHDDAGNDQVFGDSENDIIIAGEGNDNYDGGSGFDTLDFSGAKTGMNIDVSKKTATGMGNDTFSGIEKFIGSSFNDTFKGSSAVDSIDGGAGNDTLRGLGGADILTGGTGNDTFFWEKTDVGAGLGVDHITDFGAGDVLDFKKLVSLSSKPLTDFVKVTDGAAGSTISAKIGSVFVDIAVLDGVHGVTASTLLHDGHLLVG